MSNQNDYSRASWTSDLEAAFVDLLLEYSTPHYRKHNHWTKEAWRSITESINRHFPNARLNMPQVKHHEQFMRKRFNLIKKLSLYPGMRWDNVRKMVCGEPSDWEKCILEIKGAHIWRDRMFPQYDKLKTIYKHCFDDDGKTDSATSGDDAKECEANGDDISINSRHPSCSPAILDDFPNPQPIQAKPPSQDEEIHENEEIPSTSVVIFQGTAEKKRMLDDKRPSPGKEIHENGDIPSTFNLGSQGAGRPRKMPGDKRPPPSEIHENEEIPSASDILFQGAGKKRKLLGDSLENYLKGLLEVRREEMELKKQRSQAAASDGMEQFCIAKCVAATNGLRKFTDLEVIKVSKCFLDPAIRELFLSLTESQKELWILEQLQL